MKRCTKCQEVKPLAEFYRDASYRDGLRSACKVCETELNRPKRALRNPQRAAFLRAWRQRNPDRQRAQLLRWSRANPDKIAQSKSARRQQGRRLVPWADKRLMRSYYRMARALRRLGHNIQVDHIVPLRAREACGLHVHCNLALSHARDNLRKGRRITEPPAISRVRAFPVRGIILRHGLSGPRTTH